MKVYVLRFLDNNYDIFESIRSGKKTVETRAASKNTQAIAPGSLLELTCAGESFHKLVDSVEFFKSVEELYRDPIFEQVLPGVSSLKEAMDIYHSFPGYRDRIKNNGLVAFHLKSPLEIRRMKAADSTALRKLAKTYLEPWFGSQSKAVDEWILGSNHRSAWVAEYAGKVGGFAIISDKPQTDYIKLSSIVVDKPLRKLGVGQALINQCFEYLRKSPKQRMLLTIAEDNGLSISYFESKGFRLIGKIKNKYRPGKSELVYDRTSL